MESKINTCANEAEFKKQSLLTCGICFEVLIDTEKGSCSCSFKVHQKCQDIWNQTSNKHFCVQCKKSVESNLVDYSNICIVWGTFDNNKHMCHCGCCIAFAGVAEPDLDILKICECSGCHYAKIRMNS